MYFKPDATTQGSLKSKEALNLRGTLMSGVESLKINETNESNVRRKREVESFEYFCTMSMPQWFRESCTRISKL